MMTVASDCPQGGWNPASQPGNDHSPHSTAPCPRHTPPAPLWPCPTDPTSVVNPEGTKIRHHSLSGWPVRGDSYVFSLILVFFLLNGSLG